MKLRYRYNRLSFWNKIQVWAAAATFMALLCGVVFYFNPRDKNDLLVEELSRLVENKLEAFSARQTMFSIDAVEGHPGKSVHMFASLSLVANGSLREYVIDVGDASAGRLSVYIDSDNNLSMRVIDLQGEVYTLKVGAGESTFFFDEFNLFSFDLADLGHFFRLAMRINGRIVAHQQFSVKLNILPLDLLTFSVGANIEGREGARVLFSDVIALSRTLNDEEMRRLLQYVGRVEQRRWLFVERSQWMTRTPSGYFVAGASHAPILQMD